MDRRRFSRLPPPPPSDLSPEKSCACQTTTVPIRTLGRSGGKYPSIGLGGYHIGMQSDEQEKHPHQSGPPRQWHHFLDNCWDYNGGRVKVRMARRCARLTARKLFS